MILKDVRPGEIFRRKPRASGDDPWFRDRLKNELL